MTNEEAFENEEKRKRMMTEEEARKKWCPFSQAGDFHNISCIASGCIAWRMEPIQFAPIKDGGSIWMMTAPPEEMRGYCGLAGKP